MLKAIKKSRVPKADIQDKRPHPDLIELGDCGKTVKYSRQALVRAVRFEVEELQTAANSDNIYGHNLWRQVRA